MAKNVIVIESQGKIKTIKKILGPDWTVLPSGGHVRDMAKGGDGFDRETLEIHYVMSDRGKANLNRIKNAIVGADRIVIASDADREGEAIADHLITLLHLKEGEYDRCSFQEISEESIKHALANPEPLKEGKVMAQRFRRIIDRAVGFDSTKALQVKTGLWTPIGRVQTPALWMVVTRDREIESHKTKRHYSVRLNTQDGWSCTLNTKLSKLGGTENQWEDKEKAESLALSTKSVKVVKSEETTNNTPPPNAFKTTTLQKAGINTLGVTGEEVMNLASTLYDNGYITYIRTDDERISDAGYALICDYVRDKRPDLNLFGTKRTPTGKKAANAQEAHECIRAVDFSIDEIKIEGDITEKHAALYKIIHQRALASQLDDARSEGVKLTLEGEHEGVKYTFIASSSEMVYAGWKALTSKDEADDDDGDGGATDSDDSASGVPLLAQGKVVDIKSGDLLTRDTKPAKPYTENSLITEMEKIGIGRPSTYQTIVGKLTKGHAYIDVKSKNKRRVLLSNANGRKLIDNLESSLGQGILNIKYTKEMEDGLDEVEAGLDNPNQMVFDFLKRLDEENAQLMKDPIHKCKADGCNGSLVRGVSAKTKTPYWRCINDGCKYIVGDDNMKPGISYAAEKAALRKLYSNADGSPKYPCPKCQSHVVGIKGKFGLFWLCSREKDPECKHKVADDDGKPMSAEKIAARAKAQKETIERSTAEDGTTPLWNCINCNEMILKRKAASGNWWFACKSRDCGARYWPTDAADENCEPKLDAVIDDSKSKGKAKGKAKPKAKK